MSLFNFSFLILDLDLDLLHFILFQKSALGEEEQKNEMEIGN